MKKWGNEWANVYGAVSITAGPAQGYPALTVTGNATSYASSLINLGGGAESITGAAGIAALTEWAGNGNVIGTSSLSIGQTAAGVSTILARGAQALNIGVNGGGQIAISSAGALTITDTTGTVWGAPTGGAKGTGTINAVGLYVNGVAVGTGSAATVNSQSAPYTLVLGDANNIIYHPTTDNNARTFTIPANSSVAYANGTTLTFINDVNTVTIAITTDTLVQEGTGATGSRTLAVNGTATAVKVTATRWVISGVNLT